MNTQALSPQGYNINDLPMNTNPFWEQGKFKAKVNIYVDDSPIEPGFDFVFKSIDAQSIRVTSHYGYVEAELDICKAYDLQPINGTKYFLDRHELIYMDQPVDLETSRNLITTSQPVVENHPVLLEADLPFNSTLTQVDSTTYTLTIDPSDTQFKLGMSEMDTDPTFSLTLPTSNDYDFMCAAFLAEHCLFFLNTGTPAPGQTHLGKFEYQSFTMTYDNVTYTINVL